MDRGNSVTGWPLLKERRNYWRREIAQRFAFVVDGQNFFRAFYEAALRAEKQIIIVGWDTDSRAELLAEDECLFTSPQGDGPALNRNKNKLTLKRFLFDLCDARPDLRVYILSWDFNIIYSLEREVLPQVKLDWLGHERVRFVFDRTSRTLGSHHQKIIVIDDQIAFSGGLDVTARRWDTSEHLAQDDRRIDPWGKAYGPFHDVQVCVEGKAARALGDLVRERWLDATAETLTPPRDFASPTGRWPSSLPVEMSDVNVAISRTVPASPDQDPVYEVKRLFIDSINHARKFIYFEAQYFSCKPIARALARRLREPNGPEIVLVVARDATGWIEESTMTVMRARLLASLRAADLHDRFRVYYPVVPRLEKGYVKVHSKVTIVDDRFVRIGSANMNQRSMGLDTECDISIENESDNPQVRHAIAGIRSRLLAEHLNVGPAVFAERFSANGSLIQTIESFRGGSRSLVPLETQTPEWLDILVPESEVIDPSGPYRLRGGLRRYFPNLRALVSARIPWLGRFKIVHLVALVIGLLLLRDSFRTGLSFLDPILLAEWIRSSDWAPVFAVLLFVAGSFVMVPLIAMIIAAVLAFDGFTAIFVSIVGTMAAASATYALGRWFHEERVMRLANRWLKKIRAKLASGGWMSVTVVRLLPVAPFSIINLLAGAMRIPFSDFSLGTLFGTLPGLLAITLIVDSFDAVIVGNGFTGVFFVALILLMIISSVKTAKHFLVDRHP